MAMLKKEFGLPFSTGSFQRWVGGQYFFAEIQRIRSCLKIYGLLLLLQGSKDQDCFQTRY